MTTATILSTDEAVAYVKLSNRASFTRWKRRFNVKHCLRGRYAVAALEVGLQREAAGRNSK